MKFALINPNWSFDGSIYFGCREPHLPLEYGYSRALLQRAGHTAEIFDAHADALDTATVGDRVANFGAQMIVITTAPSYLFWRCAPPELRAPQEVLSVLRGFSGTKVAVGPHGSTTPRATLRKLDVDVVVLGECEETLVLLADRSRDRWREVAGLCYAGHSKIVVQGGPQAADLANLPALKWPPEILRGHRHHHHRFDTTPVGMGAEIEASRGCPYHCTFCAKENFRDRYR